MTALRYGTPFGDLTWDDGAGWTGDEALLAELAATNGTRVRLTPTGPTVVATADTAEGAHLLACHVLSGLFASASVEWPEDPPAWPAAELPDGAVG